MNKQHLNRVVDRAKEIFVRSERNLTEKGRGVLEFLLEFPTHLYRTTKPLVLTIKEQKNDRSHGRVPNFGISRSRKSGAQTGFN